jgi:antirestriction protein
MTNVRIYVGTYHKYNCGSLEGKWVDLDQFSDLSEFYCFIRNLHSDEEDPEFMFQDYECPDLIESMGLISECHISDSIYEVTEEIENSDYELEVLEACASCFDSCATISELIDKVQNCYQGEYSSDIDFCQEQIEVPEELPNFIHIDWEGTARDFMMCYNSFNNHYFYYS